MSIVSDGYLVLYTIGMYMGIDIGGTKTLAAVLDDHGVILQQTKFPTNPDYPTFLTELRATLRDFDTQTFTAAGVGMPVTDFDRERGVGIAFGNLPWTMVPVRHDIARLVGCPVALENDAKLAGLSEAKLLKQHRKVLYITISTGIGTALVVNQVIDPNVGDSGGATMLLQHKGSLQPWESFASGRAIVARFGKRAEDIHDDTTWKRIVHDWRQGFLELIAVMEPDAIVIGGSVGSYFDRYGELLLTDLRQFETPLLTIPPIIGAQRPEAAVVYGCYDYARQSFAGAGHA